MQLPRLFNRLALGRGVTFIGILLLTLSACNLVNKRGGATREEVVNTYLRALEKKDERTILSLIPKDYQAEQAVQAKVTQMGGQSLYNVRVSYQEVVGPQNVDVTIQGLYYNGPGSSGEAAKFKDTLILKSGGGRWYLILGKRTGGPTPPTSPTTKPVTTPSR